MLKKMFAMLPTGLLLTLGCSSKTEPMNESPNVPASEKAGRVTIYVAGMIEKQNIT
jgi:hypothetical protein